MHATVRLVTLVADAIRDYAKSGVIILDIIGGSGTALINAEVCGRHARLIEYHPHYCDTIIRRYERLTGKSAILNSTSETFEDVGLKRTVMEPDSAVELKEAAQ